MCPADALLCRLNAMVCRNNALELRIGRGEESARLVQKLGLSGIDGLL